MEKEKKDNRQNAPKGHRVKWYEIPSVIVVLLFLVPPVGLVLLGNSKKTNIVWKLLIGVLVFAIFAYVGSQYKLTKNTNEELSTLSIEQIEYSEVLITFENSAVSMNGKEVSASSDEKFLKVLYTINNSGSEEIYYISMLDDPCV
ncbi:MAG: hypothetical protein KAH01_02525, partial [Caldisericia bacterium]|nr:hypothetical protein [Caldisericia bacterium]